ncbi:ferrous iron transport protein A [Clostridium tetanomorphum]|uniref:Ferrous iron transport protein A n=1 Tax=Clostridium tetanomorphum TaxID=1553 RepID=A0A923J1L5_CLOTT|nr:FeoA family protein [Clostridium tetanomorphum]KAJ51268.1 FeoA family protein [Clostridium tetanomorphum DSM 665]MBC2397855.1 ferrous iron transport protein A [Clostridium tetanomorphum]MBP1864832.1 ferrous iron transport protein A [Clostridium tetanomorphum]NRS84008.1 ferrous iron transport protein A [Clostridium tetanomorphum]NRZ97225.1 ferrous iron transport protein A [Clostridium tetanomorphum]
MPLSFVNIGDEVIVKYLNCDNKTKGRLESMGITSGTSILIISNNMDGGFIVNVRGSRLILGRSITSKIIVDVL